METAEEIILRWASEEAREKMIFQGDRREVDRYLQAVDEIQSSMLYHDHIIPIAMARLEDEYRNILISVSLADSFIQPTNVNTDYTVALYGSTTTTTSIHEIDLRHSDAVNDLRSIAERMISSGYLGDCIQVHASVRKSEFDATFRSLRIDDLSSGDVQDKIRPWIRAARVCVSTFASEKKLCELIFDGVGTAIDDACFMETVKEHAIQLLNFPEAITMSISLRDRENLFKILDLYDALKNLMPDIDHVFDSNSSEFIRVQAAEILSRLAEAARGIFFEFENAVLHEASEISVSGGKILPLTMDVISYLRKIFDHNLTLNELVVSMPSTGSRYLGDPSTPNMDFAELEGKTPFEIHLIWIIEMLCFNLDYKSKHYKDVTLSHLFMMNNLHYIVQTLRSPYYLTGTIGSDYLEKLAGKFQHAAASYQRATWERVLYCLREEGLPMTGDFSSKVLRSALRKRFKAFNAMFEEVHRTQAVWLIPNDQLREKHRVYISETLIPAYRTFLERFKEHIESGRHPENYIKYSVEDLETAVSDFFKGTPVSQNLRRRFLHWRWRR